MELVVEPFKKFPLRVIVMSISKIFRSKRGERAQGQYPVSCKLAYAKYSKKNDGRIRSNQGL